MSTIFDKVAAESGEVQVALPEGLLNATEQKSLLGDAPAEQPASSQQEESGEPSVKVIPQIKRKKCIGRKPDGKKCRRLADEGSVYCDEHGDNPPATAEVENKIIPLSKDAAVKSLISFHVSCYMLTELASRYTNYPISGMNELLARDINAVTDIYNNIIDTYGVDTVTTYMNPFMGLAMISLGHTFEAYQAAEKKG